jgi:7-cyano-7-deazaguanine synthase
MAGEDKSGALVLFSGGQDSAISLAWALKNFDYVETIGFDYGQVHKIELLIREQFLSSLKENYPDWSLKLGVDKAVEMSFLNNLSNSSLTGGSELQLCSNGLPSSFVPGRNLIFLSAAAAYAYDRGLRHLVIGVSQVDFSGYPDCKQETLDNMSSVLKLGIDPNYKIHCPLMHLGKAESWSLAKELGDIELVQLILELTHTCYRGNREKRFEWGYGCNDCPACRLRAQGWQAYREECQD